MRKRAVDINYSYRNQLFVIISIILIIVTLLVFCAAIPLIKQQKDYNEYSKLVGEIVTASQEVNKEITDEQTTGMTIPSLNQSQKVYSDMVAWIYIPQSNINYPVMASEGNYYLNHLPSGKESPNGSIFCYNTQVIAPHDKADKNIVIYGHRISKRTMFGYLDTINNQGYVKDENRNKIFLYTDEGIFEYEMFSAYNISKYEDYGRINFANNDDFIEYCETLKSRSGIPNDNVTHFSEDDYLITLVSCTKTSLDKDARVVVHGKLIAFQPAQ